MDIETNSVERETATGMPETAAEPDPREVVAAMDKLEAGLGEAQRRVDEAELQARKARRALGEQELDAFLDGITVDTKAGHEYKQALARVDGARAFLAALRRRQAETDVQVLAAGAKLREARREYNEQVIRGFVQDRLRPALNQLAGLLTLAAALESATGEVIPESRSLPTFTPWDQDEAGRAFHEEHGKLKAVAERLERHRIAAGRRVLAEERERKSRPEFDPSGKYKVVRSFLASGERFEPDRIVRKADVGSVTLARMYASRYLVAVTEDD